jgi:hypothetical protein
LHWLILRYRSGLLSAASFYLTILFGITQLVGHVTTFTNFANMASTSALPPWRTSAARQLLEDDLLNGTIPLTNAEMMPLAVYRSRPEFAQYPYASFPRRLKTLRDTCSLRLNRRTADAAAYRHDQRFDVRPTQLAYGLPRWEGSEAEQWLKHDITNGLHEQMAPQALYRTRDAYQVFDLARFRGHIHQEVKRRKFITSFYGR